MPSNTKSLTKFLTDTRITGLLYLGLAVTGMFVFIIARSNIYVAENSIATKANLIDKEFLARLGIIVELKLVIFQALAAIWFYKLFSKVNNFASGALAVFGVVNAVAILISSAMWLGALNAALAGESAATVMNLFNLHETIWLVAGIFFGLWLIPMGLLAAKSMMPRALAGFLIIGGIGYITSTLLVILNPNLKSIADLMVLPATIGEFWMVGYLMLNSRLKTANS